METGGRAQPGMDVGEGVHLAGVAACFVQRTGLPSLARDGIFGAGALRKLPHSN